MAEVASAYVSLIPSARGFAAGVTRETDKAATSAGKRFGGIFSGSLKGVIGGALAGIGVTKLIGDALGEAQEARKVGALTANVIRTTGGAAKVSAKQVGDLATAISNKVGIDDEAIQSGANLLLTFKNVRNEVGKGNAIFDRATKAAVDLSASGFGDLSGTSKQLGKALNDPIKGISALGRAGVTFTAQQKDQIKTLVESGKTLTAQKIILKEVEAQVGGSAAAQATASDKAGVAVGNLKEQIGTGLLPVVDDLADRVSKDVVPAVSEFVKEMQDGTGAGGEVVDVLKDTVEVGKGVLDLFNAIPGPVKKYGAALLLAGFALNKVNNGLVSGRSAMTSWVSGLGPAGAEMTKTQKAAYGLGAGLRNAAGAGGMLLMAKSAGKADTAVGGLGLTAGAALTGFAVGGPIGAAIGGGAAGLFSLYQNLNKSKEAAKVSLPTFKEYGQTLDGVAAKTTKATREMVFQRLESSGLLAATRQLGFTDRQAVSAMMGNEAQRRRLSDALRQTNILTKEQEAALRKETGAIGSSRLAQLQKNVALAANKEELKRARTALRNFMAEPASKRVSVTGVEDVNAKLASLSLAIRQVWGAAKDAKTSGPGGIDVLLNPGKREFGGPVVAGQPYIVGERRPELFVPRVNGTIIPRVPTTVGASSSSPVDAERSTYRAFTRALADTRTTIVAKPDLANLDLLVGTA